MRKDKLEIEIQVVFILLKRLVSQVHSCIVTQISMDQGVLAERIFYYTFYGKTLLEGWLNSVGRFILCPVLVGAWHCEVLMYDRCSLSLL